MKRREQKSVYATPDTIKKNWWVIDAKGLILGRLATKIATILKGKEKAYYTPSMDTGDFVIVLNAEKIVLSGNKEETKKYYRHSGYPGGLRTDCYKDVLDKNPSRIIELAVKGMLPRTKMKLINHLKVYAGEEHPHAAQTPQPIQL